MTHTLYTFLIQKPSKNYLFWMEIRLFYNQKTKKVLKNIFFIYLSTVGIREKINILYIKYKTLQDKKLDE